MTPTLWVPGPLPNMNDLLKAAAKVGRPNARGRRSGAYVDLKAKWTSDIALMARGARLGRWELARFEFLWLERDRRRDPDNITAGGRKLILDGLVVAGVLPGDGWAHVAGWTDAFAIAERPGVRVTLLAA